MREVSGRSRMKQIMEIYPNEQEKQEYLAYKSEKDFFSNLETGISKLNEWQMKHESENVILIAGPMVAFDKGTINFLNQMVKSDLKNQYILLSEVTAEFRRKTQMCVEFEHICTPHLLAKEIIVPFFNVTVSEEMERYVNNHLYLNEAINNLETRHINLGIGYAKALMYFADIYIRVLLDKIVPKKVILWNKFYAFHSIFDRIAKEKKIDVCYMEFGCVPGTIVIENGGQQGESYPARHPWKFNHLFVGQKDILNARGVIAYINKKQLNRNIQPFWGKGSELNLKRNDGPIVTYMGQNDYESGMFPYTRNSRKYHSPIFKSTLEGLEFLSVLAIKNGWNLIYKPHPIIEELESEKDKLVDIDCKHLTEINIHEIIDYSNVVVTILSQSAYVALFRDKPVVLMGYTQLFNSGCSYEAFKKRDIEKQISDAIGYGYTYKQKKCFEKHVARLLKYYLYDDLTHDEFRFGKRD